MNKKKEVRMSKNKEDLMNRKRIAEKKLEE